MNLILINLEIIILFQKTLTQYVPNQIYPRSRHFTQGAYYLPFQNEEYDWKKSYHSDREKQHRRRKHSEYYISAEIDHGPKRLQCKCTCKRKYDSESFPNYDRNDPCCPDYCENKPDTGNQFYTSTQYPDTVDSGIYTPTEIPYYTNDNVVYTPAPYPSMIYPTFNPSEIGKFFPWITWGITKTTKDDDDMKDKDRPTSKDDRDRASTGDIGDKTSIKDPTDKSTTTDDSNKSSLTDDSVKSSATGASSKASTLTDRDRSSTIHERDKSSTVDDRDRTSSSDRNEISSRDDRDNTDTSSVKNDNSKTATIGDRNEPDTTIEAKDDTSTKEDPTEKSIPSVDENTTAGPKYTTTEHTRSTPTPTLSTFPYVINENSNKLAYYPPKKKKCLPHNCLQKNTNWKIGRYYEDDLVERPTVASYLNGNWRKNVLQKKNYEGKPHYGIIPIPNNLAVKFMNELRN